jgi:hypothetical protein
LYDQAKVTTKEGTHVLGYTGQVKNQDQLKNQQYLYDQAKVTTKEGTHVLGYTGQVKNQEQLKNQKYLEDQAKTTIKEGTHVINYTGQVGTNDTVKQQKYFYDKAKVTTKEGTHVIDYKGQVAADPKQMKYLYDKARVTTKEGTHVINYSGQAGSSQTVVPVSYEEWYNATTNNNQEDLLGSRTYGPNKATNITIGSCDVNMQLKTRTGYDITKWGQNENRLYTAIPTIGDSYQQTTSQNQRDMPGVRQPEDYVVEQHKRNPYSQSLTSAPRVTSPFVRGEAPFENL